MVDDLDPGLLHGRGDPRGDLGHPLEALRGPEVALALAHAAYVLGGDVTVVTETGAGVVGPALLTGADEQRERAQVVGGGPGARHLVVVALDDREERVVGVAAAGGGG